MKSQSLYTIAALVLLAAFCAALPQTALAANTAAGTSISNTATVNYSVGGVAQTATTGSTSFVVDRKINFTVTTLNNPTSYPSSTFWNASAMQFLITNTSNTAIRFQLTADTVSGYTNTVSLTSLAIYKDNGTSGTYDGADTAYANAGTFGDIASGGTLTVLVVGTVPAGAANGAVIKYALLARAVDSGTTNLAAATVGADTAGIDTVFADAAGTANSGDTTYDGKGSSTSTITISAASITVTKSSVVYSDPISGATGTGTPKAIPGAVILYIVKVANSGAVQADNIVISDDMSGMVGTINPNTSYDDTNFSGTGQTHLASNPCANGWVYSTNSTTGLDGTWTCGGAAGWSSNKLTVTVGTVLGGNNYYIRYQATIQ